MLLNIAVKITQVVLISFIILGTIGNILDVFIFTRRTLSKSSCTLYLIAVSIDNIIVIYTSLLTWLLTNGYAIDVATISDVLCKVRYYFCYVSLALSPYFYVLACFDRYCSSSTSAARRSWCSKKIAKRLILAAIILACILYSHMAAFFEIVTIDDLVTCNARLGPYNMFYRIFYILVYCILPSFCVGILCVLTLINVRQQSRRVQSSLAVRQDGSHRLDHHLVRMLCLQILTQLVCILPYAVFNLVVFFIELNSTFFKFFDIIFILPLYASYATSFYIFTLSSRVYRNELFKIISWGKPDRNVTGITLKRFDTCNEIQARMKGTLSTVPNEH
ncbi:unnamed protein product [Rotaria magnacalcarata]|uniref:G-protein coupled receptors family 1 profile domain-containing protein n=2 Tax=Rotaria magnacalcarata TaxID=392030 RepID=A0A819MW21_9BILA|nr:unnamed protein product [Rotaria magnacalcarata]CAF2155988.1 unnamed protein product [Rotaria magnacalcarata]CAF3988007.1 unnamed protein product [Rotaria magnacalcarata]